MATKNVYQKHLDDAIAHFNISCDPYGIMANGANGTIETVYVDESDYTFNKLLKILSDNSNESQAPDLTKMKKAFVLPNADLSLDRIKAALKEHKITVTNDYTQADLFITNDNLKKTFDNSETIQNRIMFPQLWNYDAVEDGSNIITNYTQNPDNMRSGEYARVIIDSKLDEWTRRNWTEEYSLPVDSWLLTGLAVNAAYHVEQGLAEVWDVEKIMNQSANKVELTEQLIKDLKSLSSSYNDDDTAMVKAILPTIKYNENYHLLWELSQKIGSSLYKYSSRNKDVQFWIGVSEIEDFYHKNALEMINWLEKKEKLDNKSFKYLESIVRKEIRIENRDLYTFKVQLKPEYRKYLKQKTNE